MVVTTAGDGGAAADDYAAADGPPPARRPGGGRIVLVGTPIGNLGDLSPRAVQTLAGADLIACEDTRVTRKLLTHAGITGRRLVAMHAHNEAASAAGLVAEAAAGAVVAVVTDAGMPGVSDPGARVVAAAAAAGVDVEVVPGPSAVLAALVLSGLPAQRFRFEGFLPRKGGNGGSAWRPSPRPPKPSCCSSHPTGCGPRWATWRRPVVAGGRWPWPGS